MTRYKTAKEGVENITRCVKSVWMPRNSISALSPSSSNARSPLTSHNGKERTLTRGWTPYQISLSRVYFLGDLFLPTALPPPQMLWEHSYGQVQDPKPPWPPPWERNWPKNPAQVGFYDHQTSPSSACKGNWHGTAYSPAANFSISLPEKGIFLCSAFWDQSWVCAVACIVPKLLVLGHTSLPCWPLPISTIFLQRKRATPVLYLDLKAQYTHWSSTLGQFSGFSKYTEEFPPAALGRGRGAGAGMQAKAVTKQAAHAAWAGKWQCPQAPAWQVAPGL